MVLLLLALKPSSNRLEPLVLVGVSVSLGFGQIHGVDLYPAVPAEEVLLLCIIVHALQR